MAVTSDIVESYRAPGRVVRRKLADGREDGALATLIGACLLIFLSQWPALARAAYLDPAVPLDARIGGALMATIFFLPLLAYAIAAFSHLVARVLGGQGSWLGARIAFFWALLAISPLMLLLGAATGMFGPGRSLSLLGLGVMAVFLWIWFGGLWAAESRQVPDMSAPKQRDTV